MTPSAEQRKIIRQALRYLGWNYRRQPLHLSRDEIEERPSLVWRGDSIILGSEMPRWAYRIWLGEKTRRGIRSAGFCNLRPLDLVQQCAADLQSVEDVPPVADAYLRPPLFMVGVNSRTYAIPVLAELQRMYGEDAPFGVTCYSQPHHRVGGYCAHAALFMCLSMVCLRYGLQVPAVHETSYDAARNAKTGRDAVQPDGSFRVRGLSLREMRAHMKSRMVRGSGVIEVHRADNLWLIAHRINEYLRQGLPVILSVDYLALYRGETELLEGVSLDDEHPHVVVVVGARYAEGGEGLQYDPAAFIYHDSRVAPYMEKPCETLLRSGSGFLSCPNRISFCVPVPKEVVHPIDYVAKFIKVCVEAKERGGPMSHLLPRSVKPHPAPFQRYRLLPAKRVEQCYFRGQRKDDALRVALRTHRGLLPRWMWVVEWYPTVHEMKRRRAIALWFFDATERHDKEYPELAHGAFAFLQDEEFRCYLPGFPDEPHAVGRYVKVAREDSLL